MIRKKITDTELKDELKRMTRHCHCKICGTILNPLRDGCEACKLCLIDQVIQL